MDELDGYLWDKVPRQFHRAFEDKPFDACDFCRKGLLADGVGYIVHKYYADNELRQETAVCLECLDELRRSYSQESLQILARIFDKSLFDARFGVVASKRENKAEFLTRQCLLCGAGKDQITTYFEYAYCDGEEIIYYTHPFMMCEPCALKVYEALSEETKDARRRFFRRHFGLPPTWSVGEPAEFVIQFMGNS
jgi:hypothetical protein